LTLALRELLSGFVPWFILDDDSAARNHAEQVVQFIRSWNNRIFANGLSRARTTEERERILDELYRRLVEQVAMAPADRGNDITEHFITVAKSAGSAETKENGNHVSEYALRSV